MRFVHLYLLGYAALLAGAALSLWHGGVLARMPLTWVAPAALIAIGLGVVLAMTAPRE